MLVAEGRCGYEVDILIGQIDHGDLQLTIDVFRRPFRQYLFMVIITNFGGGILDRAHRGLVVKSLRARLKDHSSELAAVLR